MSKPRPVYAGTTYLITRRCSERRFFLDPTPLPAEVTLTLVPPPAFEDIDDGGVELVTTRLAETEARLRAEAAKKGIRFVGLRRVRKQRWKECPRSFVRRMQMRPRVATRDKWRRIEALTRDKQFEIDHAEALAAWRDGNRDVVFPAGTNKMRVMHGVRCREQAALL